MPMVYVWCFFWGFFGDFLGIKIITHEYPQKKRAYIGVFDRGTLVGVHPTIPSGGHWTLYLLQYLRYIRYIYIHVNILILMISNVHNKINRKYIFFNICANAL